MGIFAGDPAGFRVRPSERRPLARRQARLEPFAPFGVVGGVSLCRLAVGEGMVRVSHGEYDKLVAILSSTTNLSRYTTQIANLPFMLPLCA